MLRINSSPLFSMERASFSKLKAEVKKTLIWAVHLLEALGKKITACFSTSPQKKLSTEFQEGRELSFCYLIHPLFGAREVGPHDAASHLYSFLSPKDQLALGAVSRGAREAGCKISQNFFQETSNKATIYKILPSVAKGEVAGWQEYQELSEQNLNAFLSCPTPFPYYRGAERAYLEKIPFIPYKESERWQREFMRMFYEKNPPLTFFRTSLQNGDPEIVLFKKEVDPKTLRPQSRETIWLRLISDGKFYNFYHHKEYWGGSSAMYTKNVPSFEQWLQLVAQAQALQNKIQESEQKPSSQKTFWRNLATRYFLTR
ncbi:MAG: hypothetical protein K0S07_1600 [Chlamydiales bacterium]|jgi:hypothetical protein|nr:hypothetical protein [Chlamydiales bacterium]